VHRVPAGRRASAILAWMVDREGLGMLASLRSLARRARLRGLLMAYAVAALSLAAIGFAGSAAHAQTPPQPPSPGATAEEQRQAEAKAAWSAAARASLAGPRDVALSEQGSLAVPG